MDYPAIEDHGLIGDLQTAALVATDGTVDWLCLPRFDSPSVFASLLDRRRGARFTLAPAGGKHITGQMYQPNTAILVTRFLSEGGVAEVVDLMPVDAPDVATDRHRLIRMITGIRGVQLSSRILICPHLLRRAAYDCQAITIIAGLLEPEHPDGRDEV